ncbi:hypothetical protein ACU635_56110 [[Actinomadura] parvosata]|uniref:hypothetical protein n=1 Tax=[Actinomadura] parvosata TaxID=1955412 RepID=UPI00406CCFCC
MSDGSGGGGGIRVVRGSRVVSASRLKEQADGLERVLNGALGRAAYAGGAGAASRRPSASEPAWRSCELGTPLGAAGRPRAGRVGRPWPRADETQRLDGAGSWMDLAAATQGGRTESASAVSRVRTSGNHSGDLSVFESSWSSTDARTGDGALANALVGTGTTAVVVLRTVWKYVVVLSLIALLLSIIRAFALGPALGALFTRMRVMGTRKALQVTLAQIERNIAGNAVAALRLAKRMLARGLIVPGLQTALVVADTLALDPFDDNSRAREEAEHVLRRTPEGRAALAYAKEHGITTLYQSGQNIYASDYDRGLNVIRIGGADWSTPEALAGEFVRQVDIAKSRWSPSPLGTSLDEYTEARSREEEAANRAAYRMGRSSATSRTLAPPTVRTTSPPMGLILGTCTGSMRTGWSRPSSTAPSNSSTTGPSTSPAGDVASASRT